MPKIKLLPRGLTKFERETAALKAQAHRQMVDASMATIMRREAREAKALADPYNMSIKEYVDLRNSRDRIGRFGGGRAAKDHLAALEYRYERVPNAAREALEKAYRREQLASGKLTKGQYDTMLDLRRKKESGGRFSDAQQRYLADLEDKFYGYSEAELADAGIIPRKEPAQKLQEFLEDPAGSQKELSSAEKAQKMIDDFNRSVPGEYGVSLDTRSGEHGARYYTPKLNDPERAFKTQPPAEVQAAAQKLYAELGKLVAKPGMTASQQAAAREGAKILKKAGYEF